MTLVRRFCSQESLLLENLAIRQQLSVMKGPWAVDCFRRFPMDASRDKPKETLRRDDDQSRSGTILLATKRYRKAREEYEAFFSLWRDADPDIPVLMKAKIEYARLP